MYMCILIFPSKIWAKKCALYMAKYCTSAGLWNPLSLPLEPVAYGGG